MTRFALFALWLGLGCVAGCSGQGSGPSDDSGGEVKQISYAKASQLYELAQQRYDKAVEQNADTVAELKENLDSAKQAKDTAYVRENPPSSEDMDKAFGKVNRRRPAPGK